MTLAEAVTDLVAKCDLEQANYLMADAGTISNDNATRLINEAVRRVAVRARVRDPKVTFTLTASQQAYVLNNSSVVGAVVWRPLKVVVNGLPLADASGKQYGVWTLDEFEQYLPKWRSDTATGTPCVACYPGHVLGASSAAGAATVYLYPAPTAAVVSAGSTFIDGYCYPHPMAYTGDSAKELKLAPELHWAVVDLAVLIAESPNAAEAEHWARLDRLNGLAAELIDSYRKENERAAQAWGSTGGSAFPDEVWYT